MTILIFCKECKLYYSRKNNNCPKCAISLLNSKKFRINLPTPEGKRITRMVEGNLSIARKVEAKLKTDITKKKHLGIRKVPLISEVWEKYETWAKANKKDYRHDIGRWNMHVAPKVNGKKMDQLSPADVRGIIDGMVKYSTGFSKDKGNIRSKEYKPTPREIEVENIPLPLKSMFLS